MSMHHIRVHPFSLTQSSRWVNGNGETRELRSWPADGAHPWRLSIATISSDQPFSQFPGVDRAFMALSPSGVTLQIEDVIADLGQFETVSFSGEDRVAPVGTRSASTDLNFFLPRDAGSPKLTLVRVSGTAEVGATAIVGLEGDLSLGSEVLAFGDSAFDDEAGAPQTFAIRGNGLMAVASSGE